MDIPALIKIRFYEQGQLEEMSVGYTFFWSGRSRTGRRSTGIAFAVWNDSVGRLLFAAGYQRSPDESPPASPERQIRHHRQCLRSPDNQP
nr:unnamed protein product [Spirometra erinaceieuropaei]